VQSQKHKIIAAKALRH